MKDDVERRARSHLELTLRIARSMPSRPSPGERERSDVSARPAISLDAAGIGADQAQADVIDMEARGTSALRGVSRRPTRGEAVSSDMTPTQ